MNYIASHVLRCSLQRTLPQHEIQRPFHLTRKRPFFSTHRLRDFSRCQMAQPSQDAANTSSSEISKQPSFAIPRRLASLSLFCGVLTAHIHGLLPRWISALAIGGLISLYSFTKGSLSLSGCISSWAVFGLTLYSNTNCFAQLLAFFISSSLWTKYKDSVKQSIVSDHKKGGQRNWIQVLCNGGLCCLFSCAFGISTSFESSGMILSTSLTKWSLFCFGSVLGSLSCCSGDTWASELGVLSKSKPRLITNFQTVPKGTNGGVSFLGLVASTLGGAIVGLTSFAFLMIMKRSLSLQSIASTQWMLVALGAFGGLFGSFVDSLLGATLQFSGLDQDSNKVVNRPGHGTEKVRRISGIDFFSNSQVNFISSLITAITIGLLSIRIAY